MKKAILIILLLLFAGCSGKKEIKAINEFKNRCEGKIKAEMQIGNWNRHIRFYCDNFKLEE